MDVAGFHVQVTSASDENGTCTLRPTRPPLGGGAAEYWKIGAGGVVSPGTERPHRRGVGEGRVRGVPARFRMMIELWPPPRMLLVRGAGRRPGGPAPGDPPGVDEDRVGQLGQDARRRARGPTACRRPGTAAWHWNTATSRVQVPSTGSSKTMSAWFSPAEGRSPV